MNACNAHENCSILNIKLPQFPPPRNLSMVEHILALIVEDGFGNCAYFERLRTDYGATVDEFEISDEPRFAQPAFLFCEPAGSSDFKMSNLITTAKSFLKFLIAPLQPRGSPQLIFDA